MKKFLFILLWLPFALFGQAEFPESIQLNNANSTTADKLNVQEASGEVNTMQFNDFLNGRAAQADTGVIDFGGLTTNSATTINIGFVDGYVVNNESIPGVSSFTHVTYTGASGVTVTTVGSGIASYVMLSSAGVISFQNTFPTSTERKAKIWLGKVSHPLGAITLVINEPDYITSPLAFSRDWAQDLGPYVNNGVYPYANGANLNINITGGTITGDGINFVTNKTDPNHLTMGAAIVASFTYRSQTGAGGATTAVTPAVYDLAGTVTAIPGSTNQATIQYFYVLPGIGYVAQLGQTIYPTFSAAVAALGKETFVRYPSFVGNVLPVAALVVTKGCTALNDTGVTAQFFRANKNGDFFGASAGTSTATLQSAYNNSVEPEITTNVSNDGFTVRRGSAADTDNVIVGQNGAGTNTFSVDGNGKLFTAGGLLTPTDTNGSLIVRNGRASDASRLQEWKNIAGTTTANINGNGSGFFTGLVDFNGNRTISVSGSLGSVTIQGDAAGGWSTGFFLKGSGGTAFGGFGADGFMNTLGGYYVGSSASVPTIYAKDNVLSNGHVLIKGTSDNGVDDLQVPGSSRSSFFRSTATTGTAPFVISSTTVSTNLNADLIDGISVSNAVYTPTYTNITNSSAFTNLRSSYSVVGDVVSLSISYSFTVTAATTNTQFTISLPINCTNVGSDIGSGSVLDIANLTIFRVDPAYAITNSSSTITVSMYPQTNGTHQGSITIQYLK